MIWPRTAWKVNEKKMGFLKTRTEPPHCSHIFSFCCMEEFLHPQNFLLSCSLPIRFNQSFMLTHSNHRTINYITDTNMQFQMFIRPTFTSTMYYVTVWYHIWHFYDNRCCVCCNHGNLLYWWRHFEMLVLDSLRCTIK